MKREAEELNEGRMSESAECEQVIKDCVTVKKLKGWGAISVKFPSCNAQVDSQVGNHSHTHTLVV